MASISFPPYHPEPVSPQPTPMSDDDVRPSYPGPVLDGSLRSPKYYRQPSPLCPEDAQVRGRHLEHERFEAFERISRERNAVAGAKKAVDLRKELALKVHKTKQVERRAQFLSKLFQPPSPTATLTPKTPPESPAIFHFSLPSPGLTSPMAMFDDLITSRTYEPWVEKVDFRLSKPPHSNSIPTVNVISPVEDIRRVKSPPSLDQITARLAAHTTLPEPTRRSSGRLPAFLQSSQTPNPTHPSAAMPSPPLLTEIGRLRMPARRTQAIASPQPVNACKPSPLSPRLPSPPPLHEATISVSHTPVTSTQLSETNLSLFERRARKSQDMLSTIRRRTLGTSVQGYGSDEEEERRIRRISAPAELPRRERIGFNHPVLSIPGGF